MIPIHVYKLPLFGQILIHPDSHHKMEAGDAIHHCISFTVANTDEAVNLAEASGFKLGEWDTLPNPVGLHAVYSVISGRVQVNVYHDGKIVLHYEFGDTDSPRESDLYFDGDIKVLCVTLVAIGLSRGTKKFNIHICDPIKISINIPFLMEHLSKEDKGFSLLAEMQGKV